VKRSSGMAEGGGGAGDLRLPESGLAAEILGRDLAPPAGHTAAGAERLYALAERLAAETTSAPQAAPEEPEIWVTFEAGGELFAVPVTCVEEVLRVEGITRLPYAPAAVRGITHRRGRVLTVMDLRVRLGLPAAELTPRSRICIVASRGVAIGLLVDAARQVVRLLPSGRQAPPADVMTARSRFVVGLQPVDQSLVILLDVDRLLLLDEEEAPPPADGRVEEEPK
jgi:purine-binding chemotaxis protein CheW